MAVMTGQFGFYGKLPVRGDFVRRGLSENLVSGWHDWICRNFAYARTAVASDWQKGWLVAPIWRFSLPPGCLSEQTVSGLVMPSVDKVGRYFPFLVCVEDDGVIPQDDAVWDQVELFCREALSYDQEPETLLSHIQALECSVRAGEAAGLWSTEGNESIPGQTLVCADLPEEEAFVKLFWA
ncbi:type VI secretion system-associated protein TagF [Acetobacter sp.]|jgi:type VI secretion system protein ImpM|uniref:type VI secretion system-associated protein TagF n=1 Tax=Acetobacter sp. TaxID=440 RepID=UPI0025BAE559|nr:type VI secretion system-associated protein TagF [Acetobacter sp.]MCH4092650.1 type VI secretion system-associated protein TagF [Acetobacter sp.]MCI1299784.1 type VI secretion system-associated protein TagF [Acetobacter sp.]MCI1315336.1 type VI secretion system-associated protein TagF [Acetobacter sp.]